jgi:hypothetical protein
VIHEGFGRGACARTVTALFIPLASNQRQCASGKVVLAAQTLHPCLGGKVLRSLCATTMRALTSLSYSVTEAAAAEVYPWRVLVVLVVVGWRAIIKVRQLIDQIWRVAAGKLTA